MAAGEREGEREIVILERVIAWVKRWALWAVVVVKWSACCSPLNPADVHSLCVKFVLEKNLNKPKSGLGWPFNNMGSLVT